MESGYGDSMLALQTALEEGAITWEDFADRVANINQVLFERRLHEPLDHWQDDTVREVDATAAQIEDTLNSVDVNIPTPDTADLETSVFDGITGSFSDALGKGFMGEWNNFSDLWDSLWKDSAKSITAIPEVVIKKEPCETP